MTEMRTGGTDTASPTPPAEAAGRTRRRRWRTGSTSTGIKRPRDWEWRRRIRANPQSLRIYRIVIATIGFVIVAVGLALVPLPGPGWVIVFIGVSIWASEFHWARRLHGYGVGKVIEWNAWVQQQSLWIRGGIVLLTCLFVNAVLWTTLKLSGIPAWVPDEVTTFMQAHLAL